MAAHSGHDGHDHGHAHGHDHGHAHGHAHGPGAGPAGRPFQIAIALNIAIVLGQAICGWIAGSVALLSDAGHNLSDVLGLAIAYGAVRLAGRPPSKRFTYGFGQGSILAALFNATLLLVVVGALSWEAVERFLAPKPVEAGLVVAVAAAAGVANGLSAWLLTGGHAHHGHAHHGHGHGRDVNVGGAAMHLVADAAVSAGVVLSGLLIWLTGALWIDPLTSLLVNAAIVWGTWSLLRESVALSMSGVPDGLDPDAVRAYLAGRPEVAALHDLHIWPLSTTDTALTAHLVVPAGPPGDGFLAELAADLKARFGIGHVTLQVETGGPERCALAAAHP